MSNTTYLPATADSLARLHTAEAVGAIVEIMRTAGKPQDRQRAAEFLIERGHGKAVQAVISVPARHAIAAKLAALDDAALLAIASAGRQRGSTGGNEGPNARLSGAGPIEQPADGSGESPLRYRSVASEDDPFAGALLPNGISASQVEDGEFDDIDPCS